MINDIFSCLFVAWHYGSLWHCGPIIVIPVVPRKHYCPVTLSLQNELVCCYDRSMAVEYNSKAAMSATACSGKKRQ